MKNTFNILFFITTVFFNKTYCQNLCKDTTKTCEVKIIVDSLEFYAKKSNRHLTFNKEDNLYKLFFKLNKTATDEQLITIIKTNPFEIVKGYAYCSLITRNDKYKNILCETGFKTTFVTFCDHTSIFESNQCAEFVNYLFPKRKRFQKSFQDEENSVIFIENKIINEQNLISNIKYYKRAKYEVFDYMSKTEKKYIYGEFSELYYQKYSNAVGLFLKTNKVIAYTIIHSYSIGENKYSNMYFQLDKNFKVVGVLSEAEMNKIIN